MRRVFLGSAISLIVCGLAHAEPRINFNGSVAYMFLNASNNIDDHTNSMFGKQLKQHSGLVSDHGLTKISLALSNQINNLTYGIKFLYRPLNKDIHKVFGYISSPNSGKLVIGKTGNAFDELVPSSSDLEISPGVSASVFSNAIHPVVIGVDPGSMNSISPFGSASNVSQIAYYTPSFRGLQFGMSWAPDPSVRNDQLPGSPASPGQNFSNPISDSGYEHNLINPDGSKILTPSGNPLTVYYNGDPSLSQRNNTVLAVRYQNDLGPVNVAIGAGYLMSSVYNGPSSGQWIDHTMQNGNHYKQAVSLRPVKSWGAGASFAAYGIQLSGMYVNSGKSGCIKNPVPKFAGEDAGDGYGVGLGYRFGNLYMSTSVQYKQDKLPGAIKEKRDVWNVGGAYTLVKGIDIFYKVIRDHSSNGLTPSYFNISNSEWNALGLKTKDTSWVYVVGTKMYF